MVCRTREVEREGEVPKGREEVQKEGLLCKGE